MSEPITREEMYLAYLNGMTDTYPEPITRTEQYLYKLCQNGMGGGGNVDLTGYATEQYVQEYAQPKGDYLTAVPDGYAKTEDIPTKPEDIGAQPAGNYLTEVPSGYATEEFVKNKIAEAELGGEEVDLSGYAQKSELPTKVSQLENDKGYLTEHQDISGKLDASALPTAINTALAQAKASGEFDGKDGTSVTITKVTESTADGGSNVVTFSDGKTVTIKNGSKGSPGTTGKTAYQYAQDGGYTGTEAEFAAKLASEVSNPLLGKKVSFLGDSICAGADDDTSYLGGYGKIIADRNKMVYENLGKGGATVTAETYSSTNGSAKGWLCRMVDNMSADADYAIVEGGVNDAWQFSDHGTITIGEISNGYNAALDDTTYYGAFESMLKRLITRFQGKKIGYIAIPKTMGLFDSSQNVPNFYHIALECCAKWGVPVCDLNTITPPSACLGTTYVPDGTHPNYEGYLKYYCDPIETWMKTLTTGGSNSAMIARKAVEEYTQGFNDAIKELKEGKLNNTGVSFRKAKLTLVDGTIIEIDVLTAVDGTVVIPFTNRVPISIDTDGSVFNGCGYELNKRLSSSGAAKDLTGSYVTGYIPAVGDDVIRIYGCDFGTKSHAYNYVCAYDANFIFIGGYASAKDTNFTTYGAAIANGSLTIDDDLNTTLTLASGKGIAYIRVSSWGDAKGAYPERTYNIEDMIITVNEEIT